VRLINGRPSPTPNPDIGWAGLPVASFPLAQDELGALEPAVTARRQASMAELTAGAPPATYSALFKRLRAVRSVDALAAALAE